MKGTWILCKSNIDVLLTSESSLQLPCFFTMASSWHLPWNNISSPFHVTDAKTHLKTSHKTEY